ncbi:MAG: radical SAM protein [Candidatus Omnitrophota bacterium]
MPDKFSKDPGAVRYWLDKSYSDCRPYLPPLRLDISITTDCNSRCSYCWHQKKSGSLLTFDLIRPVIDSLVSRKPPKLNITGGEPTIWPEFERLIGYAKGAGINNILLCTNGRRLTDMEFAKRIVSLGVSAINLSWDTLDPDKFSALRGYPLSEAQEAVANCIRIRKECPALSLTLCSVMSKQVNPDDLLGVRRFCERSRLGYFVQTFDKTEYPSINKRFMLSEAEKIEYHHSLSWLKDKVGQAVKRRGNLFTGGNEIKCYKGITTVKLSSEGKVSFCWNSRPIGNILESSFAEIWESAEAQEVREYIRDRRCKCDFDCDVFESLELVD